VSNALYSIHGVNTQQLRQALQKQWLTYYAENRQWIARLRIWVECEGERRPSSSFILGTLAALEPQLNQILPLIVDLNSNPDRIVMALGLNVNPDTLIEADSSPATNGKTDVKLLPAGSQSPIEIAQKSVSRLVSRIDESCEGRHPIAPPNPNPKPTP
jgi:hypothetical protein